MYTVHAHMGNHDAVQTHGRYCKVSSIDVFLDHVVPTRLHVDSARQGGGTALVKIITF